ncbi:hypothetical protein BDZ45DRAFT_745514 [Acephala macrosclerotiorum]|nr:hypothetical protein BDZ45DRAFT_745514 [Acephala macrosclerotiorum]
MKLCALLLAGGFASFAAAAANHEPVQCPGVVGFASFPLPPVHLPCLGIGAIEHHEGFVAVPAKVEENEVDIKEIGEKVNVELKEKRGLGCGAKCCGFGPQEPVERDLIPKDVGLSACSQHYETISNYYPLYHNAQCISGKSSPTKRSIHPITAELDERQEKSANPSPGNTNAAAGLGNKLGNRQYSGDGNKLCTTQADCKGVPFTHCLAGECVPRCSAEDEDCVGEVAAIEERAGDLLYRQCKVESDCEDFPHSHCDNGWCRMWCLTGDEDCVQGTAQVAKVEEVKPVAEPGVCILPCWTNTDCDGCGGGRCFRGRCLRNGLGAEPSVDVAEDVTTKREEDVVDASTCQSCANNEDCTPCSPFLHCRLGHCMIQRKDRRSEEAKESPTEVKRSGCDVFTHASEGPVCNTYFHCPDDGGILQILAFMSGLVVLIV